MSTKPRTPEHFPRMKHRAAGRIAKQARRLRATTTLFEALGIAAQITGQALSAMADRVAACAEAIRQIFEIPAKQSDYVLSPPPLVTTQPTTEAAPNRAASFMPGSKR